jgi:1-acyl-sn-glycerol-3-phosphate acyltransferase
VTGVPAGKLPLLPRASGALLRALFACLTRVTVEGVENIPESGPVLVIINHASNADGGLMIAYVIPKFGRKFAWPGKEEALRWPFFGWAMKQNGVFGVRRGAGDLESFKTARQVLDEGRVLAIFPEGTRSPTGALQEAKEGATVLAARSGAPILPIAVIGSQRFWPRGKVPRPGRRMTIRIGKPFSLELAKAADRRESLRLATEALMRRVAELLPPEQRGVYADAVEMPSTEP